MAISTPTDHLKSVYNCFVVEDFGGVFVLSRCFFDFSVGVGFFLLEFILFFFFGGGGDLTYNLLNFF